MNSEALFESLADELEERSRWIGDARIDADGQFILYWMRTAIRSEENPALEVAIEMANRLQKPLLVYQGLTERYPFASDRHHTFILQAARDVQRELRNRGIRYLLHVDRRGDRRRHLKSLAERAAVVVTEDMPTKPLRRWTSLLSHRVDGGVVAVDTACVVPMQLVGKAYTRAFAYREATEELYAQRISRPPRNGTLHAKLDEQIELPFNPINLQEIEIHDLVSQCEINHTIGTVPHTIGGSFAGYARWQDFKDHGINAYEQRRNNALIDGVSRLSPYLHYGMVSPARIAREAAAVGTKGATKFLDELLISRELAYAFCFYRYDHDRLSAIPNWARETLEQHHSDVRNVLSWEKLVRGQTGDSLWDSAQRSLLIHGELHNNVRMTWGKAILNWSVDAKQALERMIDLNHRYALDGRDPASYGGILWCLGQFDRPFSPEQPIFGTIRTRTTAQHAKRLAPDAYRRKVTRPLWDSRPRVAVVGAGISGLMCARVLQDHGCEVTVLEKSHSVGGRMSTRKTGDGLAFDHGAQYFTARDRRFRRYVNSWLEDGIVHRWNGRIVVVENGAIKSEKTSGDRFVATPGMNAIGQWIASDLDVRFGVRVSRAERKNDLWQLEAELEEIEDAYDIVILAMPPRQAANLLTLANELTQQVASVPMSGCWATMLAFEAPLGLPYDGAFVHNSALSWVARDSSKPGRDCDSECWVLHASPEWSDEHLESSAAEVCDALVAAFEQATGCEGLNPVHAQCHRWRYAIPNSPLAENSLFDATAQIGVCGDWCAGPRVEGAFLSGAAIAGRVLGHLAFKRGRREQSKQQSMLF